MRHAPSSMPLLIRWRSLLNNLNRQYVDQARACALGIIVALLLGGLPAPRNSYAAQRPTIVLTGTVFPAGFGLGVAADPLGLQQALWAPLVDFDDHLRPLADLAARVPTLSDG